MIYLAWDLGIGVALLAAMFIGLALKKEDEFAFVQEMRDDFATHALAALFIIVLWPIGLVLLVKELLQDRFDTAARERRKFAIRQSDLLERMAIPEIELREKVIDPLGAVPDLPFGHLHAAWVLFLQGIGPDDSVWSFTAIRTTAGECKEEKSGYVAVRDGVPGPYFLTLRKNVD